MKSGSALLQNSSSHELCLHNVLRNVTNVNFKDIHQMILMEENFSVFDIDSDQAVIQKN